MHALKGLHGHAIEIIVAVHSVKVGFHDIAVQIPQVVQQHRPIRCIDERALAGEDRPAEATPHILGPWHT
jgi:hypothetical protein